jgi:hypothetical protein
VPAAHPCGGYPWLFRASCRVVPLDPPRQASRRTARTERSLRHPRAAPSTLDLRATSARICERVRALSPGSARRRVVGVGPVVAGCSASPRLLLLRGCRPCRPEHRQRPRQCALVSTRASASDARPPAAAPEAWSCWRACAVSVSGGSLCPLSGGWMRPRAPKLLACGVLRLASPGVRPLPVSGCGLRAAQAGMRPDPTIARQQTTTANAANAKASAVAVSPEKNVQQPALKLLTPDARGVESET